MAVLPTLNPNLLQGSSAQSVGGSSSLNVAYGTYELTLTSNATLTLNASSNGVSTTLYLKNSGYTLTIAGAAPGSNLSISGKGSWLTVLKTSDGWIGGATAALTGSSTTGTTQATSTTGTGTATTTTTAATGGYVEVAHLDLSVAEGTLITAPLKLSTGTAPVSDPSGKAAVRGGKLVSLAGEKGDITFRVPLPKQRITIDYDMTGVASYFNERIFFGVGGDGNWVAFLKADGSLSYGISTNGTSKQTDAGDMTIPLKGTAVWETTTSADSKSATAAFSVNGVLKSTFAITSTIDATLKTSEITFDNSNADGTSRTLVVSRWLFERAS